MEEEYGLIVAGAVAVALSEEEKAATGETNMKEKEHICREFEYSVVMRGVVCKECGVMFPWLTDKYRCEHGDKITSTRNIEFM